MLNSVNTATALHRIAGHLKRTRAQRDRVIRDERFIALLDMVADNAPKCNPRSVSDTLWAFGWLQHWPPSMLKPLLTQVAVHLQNKAFEAQHLALIVWSFAILELKPVKLLDAIDTAALSQLRSLNTQNVANILWGFAKLNYKPQALLGPICNKLLNEPGFVAEMKPVEITDTAFALALLGDATEHKDVILRLAVRAQPSDILSSFNSRQVVTLTWACARLQIRPPELDAWVERVQELHAKQPLLAQDQRNLERALERFDVSSDWLRPEPVDDEAVEDGATPAH